MGKLKKAKSVVKGDPVGRSSTLAQDLVRAKFADEAKPTKIKRKGKARLDDDNAPEFMDASLSAKILTEARKQQEDLEDEVGPSAKSHTTKRISLATSKDEENSDLSDNEEFYTENALVEQLDEQDEQALEKFMSSDRRKMRTLADVILDKINEKQTELSTQLSDGGMQVRDLDPRLVEMFHGVRDVLSKYRSGRLPKPFKVVPNLANWEQILALTEPDQWTAAAMYAATRIFVSNLNAKLCQRFLNLILLPRIRDDIEEYKRLNPHLYAALRKALFKPGAFFKGVLLPLCESRTCTLREATIIGSVLTRCSVPMLHAAAAMLKIAEMEYSGANSIFLKILFEKKYALPFRVLDGVVAHFLRFHLDNRELPLLWHQALLAFVQQYREDISSEQKDALLDLIKVHFHYQISLEIRKLLESSSCRDIELDVPESHNPEAF